MSRKHLLILLVVSLILLGWFGSIDISDYPQADAHSYKLMAENGFDSVDAPFCYRILAPKIVSILPVLSDTGFRLLTYVLIIVTAVVFYFFLVQIGIHSRASLVATILLLCNKYLIGFLAWNYYQVADLLGFLALILLFIFLQKRYWVWFSFVFVLGLISRETAILIVPSSAVFLWKQNVKSDWIKLGLSVLPGLAIAIGLRIVFSIESANLLVQFSDGITKWTSAEVWFRTLIHAWIPISFLPIIF